MVTDFGTSPIYDFLLLVNTNLHPISYRFQVIADYWSNLRSGQEVPLFNTLVQDKPQNSRPRSLVSRNEKHRSVVWCKMRFDILKPFRRGSQV